MKGEGFLWHTHVSRLLWESQIPMAEGWSEVKMNTSQSASERKEKGSHSLLGQAPKGLPLAPPLHGLNRSQLHLGLGPSLEGTGLCGGIPDLNCSKDTTDLMVCLRIN